MIFLIAGASHTGKTYLAQKILEKCKYPYLSLDHLKMGLIRSGQTQLTPCDDDKMTDYLWPIVKEMIKTAIENKQNLVVEGCYIPYDWKKDFKKKYLSEMKYICLVMSEGYIRNHFYEIKVYANRVESRLDDSYCTEETVLRDNRETLKMCIKHEVDYLLIDSKYDIDERIRIWIC